MIVVGHRPAQCPVCRGLGAIRDSRTHPMSADRTCTACNGAGVIRQAEHTTERNRP